jgi:hypothetical protein
MDGPPLTDIQREQFRSIRTSQVEKMKQQVDRVGQYVEQLEIGRKGDSTPGGSAYRPEGEVALDMCDAAQRREKRGGDSGRFFVQ